MIRLVRMLAIQWISGIVAWYFVAPAVSPVQWAVLSGVIAIVLARLCLGRRLMVWCYGLLIPMAVFAWWLAISPWSFMVAFLIVLAFGRNAWQAQVPFYRSSHEVVRLLAKSLAPGCHVLEAGAGDARLTLWLARLRPDLQVTALENAWGSFWLARLRWRLAGRPDNVRLCLADIWHASWHDYDAVYVFLSPAPMKKVWEKFQLQAKPGALLISNTFGIPGVEPAQCVPLSGRLQQSLLFWRFGYGTE